MDQARAPNVARTTLKFADRYVGLTAEQEGRLRLVAHRLDADPQTVLWWLFEVGLEHTEAHLRDMDEKFIASAVSKIRGGSAAGLDEIEATKRATERIAEDDARETVH